MHTATLHVRSRTLIACPACDHIGNWTVDHLFVKAKERGQAVTWGPWWCDACGASIYGRTAPDGTVQVELREERREWTASLLRREDTTGTLYLVVKSMRFVNPAKPESEEEHQGHHRYYFEEGTCPTNYFREVLAVIADDEEGLDGDPHGVFTFVGDVSLRSNAEVLGDGMRTSHGSPKDILALFGVAPR